MTGPQNPYGQPAPGWPPRQPGEPAGYERPPAYGQQPEPHPGGYRQPGPGYGPPMPPQQPPRKKHAGRNVFLSLAGLAVAVIAIGAALSGGSKPAPAPAAASSTAAATAAVPASSAPAAPQTVTYVVTGTPGADVTYGTSGTNLSGAVPLHVTQPLGTPDFYQVNAQLQGTGAVTCEILVDGKVIDKQTAAGGYNIAGCEISQNILTGKWESDN